jgi:hypothetical protein
MKIYLVCEIVDLGYHAEYAFLSKASAEVKTLLLNKIHSDSHPCSGQLSAQYYLDEIDIQDFNPTKGIPPESIV